MRRKTAILAAIVYFMAGLPFVPAAVEAAEQNRCLAVHNHHRAGQSQALEAGTHGTPSQRQDPNEQLCCHLNDLALQLQTTGQGSTFRPLASQGATPAYIYPLLTALYYPVPVPPG